MALYLFLGVDADERKEFTFSKENNVDLERRIAAAKQRIAEGKVVDKKTRRMVEAYDNGKAFDKKIRDHQIETLLTLQKNHEEHEETDEEDTATNDLKDSGIEPTTTRRVDGDKEQTAEECTEEQCEQSEERRLRGGSRRAGR
jgi:hypothetical protein